MWAEVVALELEKRGITDIRDYSIEEIADLLEIGLGYTTSTSYAVIIPDGAFIYINNTAPEFIQREEFFHELAHIWLNHNNFIIETMHHLYTEGKADHLMYLLAMPSGILSTYNMKDNQTISQLSEDFKVSLNFVYKRIQLYVSNNEYMSNNEREWFRFMLQKKLKLTS